MADKYTAWNGEAYPWPPPEGWELKSDGRYWPADQGPAPIATPPDPAAEVAPPPTPPDPQGFASPSSAPQWSTPADAPPPTASPVPGAAPAPGTIPPPGAMPPPGAVPPPGAAPPPGSEPPPAKKSNRGLIILLVIVGFIVLLAGGCGVLFLVYGDDVVDTFNEMTIDIQEAEASVEFIECGDRGGDLIASGTITNVRDVKTDYTFAIVFVEPDGTRDSRALVEVNDVEPGDDGVFRVRALEPPKDLAYTCEVTDMFLEPIEFGN